MNVAYQTDEFYEPRQRGTANADKYLLSDRKFACRQPAVVTVDTGIDEVGKIEIRSKRAPSTLLLEQLEQAVGQLRQIRSLAPNWDSYDGPRINSSAFEPATKIVLNAISRCEPPRIEGNSAGGIDLIWEKEGRSLTLSAFSSTAFEALFVDHDEITEPEGVVGLTEAQRFLDQYCANR